VWSAGALLAAVVCAVVGLVGASIVGNRVNGALPRGLGLVGMAVTGSLMLAVLVVLISPKRLWQYTRAAFVACTSRRHNEWR
jgi:hypothetical protein